MCVQATGIGEQSSRGIDTRCDDGGIYIYVYECKVILGACIGGESREEHREGKRDGSRGKYSLRGMCVLCEDERSGGDVIGHSGMILGV